MVNGYKIIDLKGIDMFIGGTVRGIHEEIKNSTKPIMLTGIINEGIDLKPMFLDFQPYALGFEAIFAFQGDDYSFHVGIEDEITITKMPNGGGSSPVNYTILDLTGMTNFQLDVSKSSQTITTGIDTLANAMTKAYTDKRMLYITGMTVKFADDTTVEIPPFTTVVMKGKDMQKRYNYSIAIGTGMYDSEDIFIQSFAIYTPDDATIEYEFKQLQ